MIDAHLANLRKGATVVNLGCGSNQAQHHALASRGRVHQFGSTLVLADMNTIRFRAFGRRRPSKIEVISLNAAAATSVLGKKRVDLVLAFGLFGDLSGSTTSEGKRNIAWPAVLRECFQLLKPSGKLIVCNSCTRQPFDEFQSAVEAEGFIVSLSSSIAVCIRGR